MPRTNFRCTGHTQKTEPVSTPGQPHPEPSQSGTGFSKKRGEEGQEGPTSAPVKRLHQHTAIAKCRVCQGHDQATQEKKKKKTEGMKRER